MFIQSHDDYGLLGISIVMRYLYSLLLYLCMPLIFLRLLWRARKNPAYLQRLPERFGFVTSTLIANSIWIHAVSVGEVVAAIPMIKALQTTYPHIPILVTTMTPTGAERVRTALADTVTHLYLPYDFPDAVRRFLKKVKPQLCLIMETELWPNLLQACRQKNIPVLLMNARLSARSAAAYLRFAQFSKSMLQALTFVCAQTSADAERFIRLGMDAANIQVTGSIKFDLEIPVDLTVQAKALREVWGEERLVWIAASTHEGEEELILQAFAEVLKNVPETLLVIVPRHPERFQKVAALCRKQGYHVIMRTDNQTCSMQTKVFVGDTMGELLLFYAAADIAYVGGSLVPKGGQNPLEPAAIGLPILTGPYLFNFGLINQQLQTNQAAIQIDTPQQLAGQVTKLLQDKNARQHMGAQGKALVENNRGALVKQMRCIERFVWNIPSS